MRGKNAIASLVLLLAGALLLAAAGTQLSVLIQDVSVACREDGTGADVTITYTVTSSGAANAAAVTATVDGNDQGTIATIASGNVANGGGWTFVGSTKSFEGTFTTFLANGSHTVVICATQAGSNGNPSKFACSAPQTINVDCTPYAGACANTAFKGEITNNPELCRGNSAIEIQFEGDFGPSTTLDIVGPSPNNSFTQSVTVYRAGDSCQYHYNWNANNPNGPNYLGNGGAGSYTFTVHKAFSDEMSFTSQLLCSQ